MLSIHFCAVLLIVQQQHNKLACLISMLFVQKEMNTK